MYRVDWIEISVNSLLVKMGHKQALSVLVIV